ncbi:MAG: hypothetical protein K2Q09_09105, partial [Phycisphaerales bacterium]|nr:hypothetical protein [Phycisphaerales bacterium]
PGQMWQTLENKASDVLARMRNEPAEKTDQIRRYRGIATAGRMSQSAEIPAEERERAKQDLLAAMNGPEHDGLAAAYYGELIRWWSTKLRQTANQEKADTLMAEGLAVLRDFCAKNPTSSIGRLGLVQLEIADAQVRRPMEDISGELRPKIEELLATMESEDPKTLDALAVTNGLQMAVTIKADRAVERGVAVYEKLCAAHPGDAEAMLLRARFKANTQSPKEAAAEFKAIMDLPNQPVSPAGINLFGVRDTAAILRTETLTAAAEREMTDKTKSKEERALALDQAKAARDELKARPTVDNSAKLLADAKIAWLNGEGGDARRLLDQYHRSLTPPYSDTGALSLSFQILRQQGLKGEAMSMLNRLLEMKVFSAEIYKQKALLEVELGNAPSALNSVDAGLALAPTDELLLRLKRDILSRLGNGAAGPATPFDTAINEAQKALTAAPPDKQRARQQGNEALSLASTAEEFVKATVVLANVGRADGLAAAKRGIERFPDNKQMLGLKSQLEIEDPVGDMLKRIDQATELTPVEKAARKYVLLSNAGRAEETRKQAEELAKLDPDHQLVVADRFEQAISDRDEAGKIKPEALARAKALAQTAKDRNLDKVEGRIYAARLAEAEGRIADTIPLMIQGCE